MLGGGRTGQPLGFERTWRDQSDRQRATLTTGDAIKSVTPRSRDGRHGVSRSGREAHTTNARNDVREERETVNVWKCNDVEM